MPRHEQVGTGTFAFYTGWTWKWQLHQSETRQRHLHCDTLCRAQDRALSLTWQCFTVYWSVIDELSISELIWSSNKTSNENFRTFSLSFTSTTSAFPWCIFTLKSCKAKFYKYSITWITGVIITGRENELKSHSITCNNTALTDFFLYTETTGCSITRYIFTVFFLQGGFVL